MAIIVYLLFFVPTPEPITETVTVTEVDTVFAPAPPPIIVSKEVTLIDTFYVYVATGDTINTEVAELDTTFIDSASLSIDYFLEPRTFEIEYQPAPPQVIEKTVTETVTNYVDMSKWWDKFVYGFSGGVGFMLILLYLI